MHSCWKCYFQCHYHCTYCCELVRTTCARRTLHCKGLIHRTHTTHTHTDAFMLKIWLWMSLPLCSRYRVAKTHRILYLYRSFSAKENLYLVAKECILSNVSYTHRCIHAENIIVNVITVVRILARIRKNTQDLYTYIPFSMKATTGTGNRYLWLAQVIVTINCASRSFHRKWNTARAFSCSLSALSRLSFSLSGCSLSIGCSARARSLSFSLFLSLSLSLCLSLFLSLSYDHLCQS